MSYAPKLIKPTDAAIILLVNPTIPQIMELHFHGRTERREGGAREEGEVGIGDGPRFGTKRG
jgi:hypothetical protein